MRVLFIGDIIGRPGRRVLKKFLPRMIEESGPTFIIANGENTAGGVGITEKVGQELFEWVDVLSSGNHVWDKKEGISYIDREPKILRPANYPPGSPGKGSGVFLDKNGEKIGVLNLQGRVFMEPIDCPFRTADRELENLHRETTAIIIDFHAEATSEKQALGWYLDGRVSAVIGTHTHVPTADEKILPGGTAYITDVGMAGGYISVIGIRRDQAIKRFLTSRPQHFEPSKEGNFLSTVVFDIDPRSGKASSIKRKIFAEENIE
ncbi:MAG: TIGR00282 family metallophosphoesterase [Candidatus Aminicenantes bacterium]|nr:TIGR00282 family metallophosphoesterase [Candidatus Aminicenantes bacterium]